MWSKTGELGRGKYCTPLFWTSWKHMRGNTPLLFTGCSTEAPWSTPHLIALNSSQVLFRLKQFTFISIYRLTEKTMKHRGGKKPQKLSYCPNTSASHFTQSPNFYAFPSVFSWQQCSFSFLFFITARLVHFSIRVSGCYQTLWMYHAFFPSFSHVIN